jgi:hypothetical protein
LFDERVAAVALDDREAREHLSKYPFATPLATCNNKSSRGFRRQSRGLVSEILRGSFCGPAARGRIVEISPLLPFMI